MTIPALSSLHSAQAPSSLADLPIEQLAGNQALSEQEKINEASRQFEALILRQILGQARKKVIHSTVDGDSMANGIYQDMVTNQLADAISRSGSFGLARSLQVQLTKPSAPPAAAEVKP